MREGILNWYPFIANASVLYLCGDALIELLKKRCGQIISADGDYDGNEKFDYLVVIDPGELKIELLEKYHSYLKTNGRLLLAFENPYGLQYFAGKRNPRTDMLFQFWFGESKKEAEIRLKQAGFTGQKWYYPFTNHYFAREVYSESYLPNEFLNMRGYFFMEDDYTKAFDERGVWREVIRNGAFEFLCNSYLVEARVNASDSPCDVDFAAITAYREPDKAFITTIHSDGTARKTAVFSDGVKRLKAIADNHNDLIRLGVNVLPLEFVDDYLTMKRVDLSTLWDYWTGKLTKGELDENELFSHYDRIRDAIYTSATDGKCYWELVPANCFYDEKNDELMFFDQEYYWENVDPDMALVRGIYALIYSVEFRKNPRTERWLELLKERYNLSGKWDELSEIADNKTNKFVFNNSHTFQIERVTERTAKRVIERVAENTAKLKEERERERARYNKMCIAIVTLQAMNVKRPAIYGYGVRGKMLRYVIEMIGLDVEFIIDKELPIVRGVPLFERIEDVPDDTNSDVIVVTPVKDAELIAQELRAKVRCQVITIEELMNE
jgi:hypothetical protein